MITVGLGISDSNVNDVIKIWRILFSSHIHLEKAVKKIAELEARTIEITDSDPNQAIYAGLLDNIDEWKEICSWQPSFVKDNMLGNKNHS